MILVPKENAKIPWNIANIGYTMTHTHPFTSKDMVTYQINGKITMSKEKKMNKKEFWVGRMLLITCSISKQNILSIFKTNTYTLQNILQTWKHFQKRQTSLYTFLQTRIITKIA